MKTQHLAAVAMMVAAAAVAQTAPAKTGQGVGVVTAIDAKAARVTIKHGSIPAIGWLAMTMTFRATPPSLLKGVRVGQTVTFAVSVRGMDAAVTAIKPR